MKRERGPQISGKDRTTLYNEVLRLKKANSQLPDRSIADAINAKRDQGEIDLPRAVKPYDVTSARYFLENSRLIRGKR